MTTKERVSVLVRNAAAKILPPSRMPYLAEVIAGFGLVVVEHKIDLDVMSEAEVTAFAEALFAELVRPPPPDIAVFRPERRVQVVLEMKQIFTEQGITDVARAAMTPEEHEAVQDRVLEEQARHHLDWLVPGVEVTPLGAPS